MKTLIILNERPGADERAYNAVRIAAQLQKDDPSNKLFIYLIADGVFCSLADVQEEPGILNVEQKLAGVIENGGSVKMCTSCGQSRNLMEKKIITGAEWTNLKALTDWISECDKVISF